MQFIDVIVGYLNNNATQKELEKDEIPKSLQN